MATLRPVMPGLDPGIYRKNWLRAISKAAFKKIMQRIEEARASLEGTADKSLYRVHVPKKIDVKKIRKKLGLSQESFAATYGFAVSAVRDWEQGRRQPERSARILLKIVEKERGGDAINAHLPDLDFIGPRCGTCIWGLVNATLATNLNHSLALISIC